MSNVRPLDALGRVRLLVCDVDGVLTDGRLYYGAEGEVLKAFNAKDGLGLKLLQANGVEVAIISGRSSSALDRRLVELGIVHAVTGCHDKLAALRALSVALNHDLADIAFVGDDLPDVAVFEHVGVAITVADGHRIARSRAHWITETPGGAGAVREIADGILEARVGLDRAADAYLASIASEKTDG